MPTRLIALVCYAGAAGLAVLAAVWALVPHVAAAIAALVGAIFWLLAGIRLTETSSAMDEISQSDRDEIDHLRSQLEQQKETVDQLADSLDVAIFICDGKAMVRFANEKVVEMFRFQHPVGMSLLAVTLSHELEGLVRDTMASGEPQAREVAFTYPLDRVARVRTWTRPLPQVQVFVSIYDITDLRRLERVRQDFVANVSHELRTPLSIIRGRSEMMLDEGVDSEMHQKYLTKIIAEVDRLAIITQDLLILSAAESNPVRKQACDLAEVFLSAIHQLTPKAAAKGLTMSYEGPDSLMAPANRSQMTQVAYNLLDNAIAYTATGGISVTVEQDDDTARIHVKDTGIGIASDHIDRIFERFYRVDKARSRASGGTGLGLSIVKHIVEAHGGSVTVDSSLNQGSEFTVALGLNVSDNGGPSLAPPPSSVSS